MNPHPEALFWGVFTVVVAVIVITRGYIIMQNRIADLEQRLDAARKALLKISEQRVYRTDVWEFAERIRNMSEAALETEPKPTKRREWRDRPMASERLPRGERRNVSN